MGFIAYISNNNCFIKCSCFISPLIFLISTSTHCNSWLTIQTSRVICKQDSTYCQHNWFGNKISDNKKAKLDRFLLLLCLSFLPSVVTAPFPPFYNVDGFPTAPMSTNSARSPSVTAMANPSAAPHNIVQLSLPPMSSQLHTKCTDPAVSLSLNFLPLQCTIFPCTVCC